MMVKFATICDFDGCSNRSVEYTAWPSCSDCDIEFCPAHGKITFEDEGKVEGICNDCLKENNDLNN